MVPTVANLELAMVTPSSPVVFPMLGVPVSVVPVGAFELKTNVSVAFGVHSAVSVTFAAGIV
jgi:hypothetical protein